MNKDFDGWNKRKQYIDGRTNTPFYHIREVWWCALGVNIGTEQDGKGVKYARPCVVVSALGRDACIVVPLTTSPREHPLRIAVGMVQDEVSKANISQLRVIDSKRLLDKVGFLDEGAFTQLKNRIRNMF